LKNPILKTDIELECKITQIFPFHHHIERQTFLLFAPKSFKTKLALALQLKQMFWKAGVVVGGH